MSKKNLVCVVCELRTDIKTFDMFRSMVLEPCDADLLLCIPGGDFLSGAQAFLNEAKFSSIFDNSKNVFSYFDDIALEFGLGSKWRKFLRLKSSWWLRSLRNTTTRPPFDQPTGAAYVLLYRHLVWKLIKKEGLEKKYERFIITRSDHFYGATHPPLNILDPGYVWIPEGQDNRGYSDRHWVLSSEHLDSCLNLLEPILRDTDWLCEIMQNGSKWNSETYVKLLWDIRKVTIKRFPRVQCLLRYPGIKNAWTNGYYRPEVGMDVAYRSEFREAFRNSRLYSRPGAWEKWGKEKKENGIK